MRCPACGHENSNGASFCGACGTPLAAEAADGGGATPPAAGNPADRPALGRGLRWALAGVAVVVIAAVVLGGARALRRGSVTHAVAGTVATAPVPAPQASPPSPAGPTTTATADVPPGTNIAASDVGGELESVGAAYGGPGLTGEALIDGTGHGTWQPDTMASDTTGRTTVIYPQDFVVSFYKRDTALVSAVVLHNADPGSEAGPSGVEVWTSMDSASSTFTRVAATRMTDTVPVQAISFTPIEARYVRVRIDSGPAGRLELAQIQVIEGSRPGYLSLVSRHPDISAWKTSVRHAAQRGIDWLEPAAMHWQHDNQCFGCHVQAQTMMGLSVAQANGYVVSATTMRNLADYTRTLQDSDGHEIDKGAGNLLTPTQFAAMGMAYYDETNGIKRDPTLQRYLAWLTAHVQPTGEVQQDFEEAPIAQGSTSATANAAVAFMQAYAETGDSSYKARAERGLTFIASDTIASTQDEVFKVIVLSRYGTDAERQVAARVVQQLQSEQDKDGGWRETKQSPGSNAFATGQVLYAFKEAGVSIASPAFSRGVNYLIATQDTSGFWPALNTQSSRPSNFAPTMWAVIGLAGTVEPPNVDSLKAELDKSGRIILYINFDFDKATLRPDSKPIVAQVLTLLQKYPSLVLAVNGHTDNIGGHDYNVRLSQQRAAAVVAALVTAHIAPNRLSSGGFGPDQPIADNGTEKGRAKNRRVELIKE